MEMVKDNDIEDDEEMETKDDMRFPIKLLGRGGFSHPRGSRGSGRGRGGGIASSVLQSTTPSSTKDPFQTTKTPDPMEGLASSMSALQFMPHSLKEGIEG
ncbi:hypothetical protein N0V90_011625 [Kalmusia sp. IMI 367209]|nr:hypothetical protein N0V90_011625 [Kalmusia sp. IMI 367209]